MRTSEALRRVNAFGTALVLSISALVPLALSGVASAAVQTCTWTGSGGNTNFSTAGNWSGCGSDVPQAGDNVVFETLTPQSGNSIEAQLTNDLDVSLGDVTITNDGNNNSTTYYISTLTLVSGATVTNTTDGWTTVYLGTSYSDLASLNGDGDLTMVGPNPIAVESYKIDGDLTLTNGVSIYVSPVSTFGGIIIQNGAQLSLTTDSTTQTYTTPITLGGGSGTAKPVVYVNASCPGSGQNCTLQPTTWTISSPITLLSDAYVSPSKSATVNITGAISGSGKKIIIDPIAYGTLVIDPSSNSSSTTTGKQVQPKTKATLTDSLPSTGLTVDNNSTIVLDGTRGYAYVNEGGVLMGTGTMQSLYVSQGAIVAPGHSPGCLTVNGQGQYDNLNVNGTYKVDVGGTTACTGYDQIKVKGPVDLGGHDGQENAKLEASLYNGFVPKVGQSYTIITNDGSDAVVGTFDGIDEGGTYTNDGVTYTVTYKGGDGNDVVLTVKSIDASKLPKSPNTGLAFAATHPFITLGVTSMMAGVLYILARRYNSLLPTSKQ